MTLINTRRCENIIHTCSTSPRIPLYSAWHPLSTGGRAFYVHIPYGTRVKIQWSESSQLIPSHQLIWSHFSCMNSAHLISPLLGMISSQIAMISPQLAIISAHLISSLLILSNLSSLWSQLTLYRLCFYDLTAHYDLKSARLFSTLLISILLIWYHLWLTDLFSGHLILSQVNCISPQFAWYNLSSFDFTFGH